MMGQAAGTRWRRVVAGTLIVIAALAVPLATLTAWAQSTLLDTDRFVAATVALRDDPAVRDAIGELTTQAIMDGLDVESRARDGLEGLAEAIGLPPRTSELLPSLAGPITQAIEEYVATGVTSVVDSDRFDRIWQSSLRTLHGQLIGLLEGNDTTVLGMADGTLTLKIGELVNAVRDQLVERGFRLARFLPDSQATIAVVTVDPAAVAAARTAYRLVNAAVIGLPVIAVLALVGAVWVAVDRPRAVRWAGVAVALAGLLMVLAVVLGTNALASALDGPLDEPGSARVAAMVLNTLRSSAWMIVAGGGLITAIGLLLGRRPPAPIELG